MKNTCLGTEKITEPVRSDTTVRVLGRKVINGKTRMVHMKPVRSSSESISKSVGKNKRALLSGMVTIRQL